MNNAPRPRARSSGVLWTRVVTEDEIMLMRELGRAEEQNSVSVSRFEVSALLDGSKGSEVAMPASCADKTPDAMRPEDGLAVRVP